MKITIHFVYTVKHDGQHKVQLVTGGHLTETPIDSVYSSVISLCGILRLLTFIVELNQQEAWATDIGNAYLESYTNEKVHIVAGPEFGDRAGHTLVISKAFIREPILARGAGEYSTPSLFLEKQSQRMLFLCPFGL